MYAKQLETLLGFMLKENLPVLIKGAPGIGKSDIVEQACAKLGWKLVISHPVVADPTDYKGLPFVVTKNNRNEAHFLPFGELLQLIDTKVPLVYFLDDLGQASPSVQSAVMQLLLARQINGHKISDHVRFVAATNRRSDKANVSGILEPVKSRFASIVELEVSVPDWIGWAIQHNMPSQLTSFIQFKPELLSDFKPSRDIENSPSPRTVSYVGEMWNAGIPQGLEFEVIKGAAGEGFSLEFLAFIKVYMNLPTIAEILNNPSGAKLPDTVSGRFAIMGAVMDAMDIKSVAQFITYLQRLGNEYMAACMKQASIKTPAICATKEFTSWAILNSNLFM